MTFIQSMLRLIKFGLWIGWLAALFIFSFHLVEKNNVLIELDVWGFVFEYSKGVTFLLVLILGFLIGVFSLLMPLYVARRKVKRLEAKQKVAQEELKQLRIAPLQG